MEISEIETDEDYNNFMTYIKTQDYRYKSIIEIELENFLDTHKWGGSGIERSCFEFILKNIEIGSGIIEIGSGYCSTKAFSKFYKLTSIDDNIEYINIYDDVNYIHAPITGTITLPPVISPFKNSWYDVKIIVENLPDDYKMVFVDGPLGSGNRGALLNNLNIFKKDTIFIFHDTYREHEIKLANDVASKLNKKITFHSGGGDSWAMVG
jgi:hypothetical protein